MNRPYIQHFGYYFPGRAYYFPETAWTNEEFKGIYKFNTLKATLLNIAGYIPIIGFYTCWERLKIINSMESSTFKAVMIGRGTIEAIGMGVFFLIPDLIVTFLRTCLFRETYENKILGATL